MTEVEDQARRLLRRVRVLDALDLHTTATTEARERTRLFPLLLGGATEESLEEGDSLDGRVTDAAASVALAKVVEPPLDQLSAVMLAAQVLSIDHQWARLAQLAGVVDDLAKRVGSQRPWLGVGLAAFAEVLGQRRRPALNRLNTALGLEGALPQVTEKSRENLSDALVASAFSEWLRDRSTEGLQRAAELASTASNSAAHELSRVLYAYAGAQASSDLRRVLSETTNLNARDSQVATFLRQRNIAALFPAQVRALRAGAVRDGSSVVAMPTSSGKTLIAELKILSAIAGKQTASAIYIAPYRVLARQVESDLRRALRGTQLEVQDLGTRFDSGGLGDTQLPDVAVMTPERLDGLLRLAFSERDGADRILAYLRSARVLVVDEAHLIASSTRGVRLELVLTRFRQQFPDCDVLALSGVAGSVESFASWLDARAIVGGSRPTGSIEVAWGIDGRLVQRFGTKAARITTVDRKKTAGEDAADLVARIPGSYAPVLVIETTRPLAQGMAGRVWQRLGRLGSTWRTSLSVEDRGRIEDVVASARAAFGAEHPLTAMLQDGIAFHHAGLPANILQGIEDLARRRLLRVVVATTTVAEGAHLPFQVVVLPHLNFQSDDNRLDKTLYLNIVGRAGRAGVAMEGIVIILESDAQTLRGHVRRSLWDDSEVHELESRLHKALMNRGSFSGRSTERDLESQALAWLGEPGSYSESQCMDLSRRTLAGLNEVEAEEVAESLDELLSDLADHGLARAGSPFRLTNLGTRSRMAGLGAASCRRLDAALEHWSQGTIDRLPLLQELDDGTAVGIAALVYETEEVLENGLWARRVLGGERDVWRFLLATRGGHRDWPYGEELFDLDVAMLSRWIRGDSFGQLATMAPVYKQGLFKNGPDSSRAADAADLMGRIAYPASWAWLAAIAMLGDRVSGVPTWLRSAIELGLPSEVGVRLAEEVGVARPAAVELSGWLPTDWGDAEIALRELPSGELEVSESITADDVRRVLDWQEAPPR